MLRHSYYCKSLTVIMGSELGRMYFKSDGKKCTIHGDVVVVGMSTITISNSQVKWMLIWMTWS